MRRIPQLDGVRALAILMVFLHHALNVELLLNLHGLWIGVDIFFVLSGFLITGILLDAKEAPFRGYLSHFYARRARRILVPYAFALAAVSALYGVAWAHTWYYYVFLNNLILPLHVSHVMATDPFWSLAVEEQFYLLWPPVVYFLSRRRLAQVSIALVVIAPVLRGSIHFADHWPIFTLTPFRMDMLAAGALISLVWRERRDLIERWGTPAGCGAAFLGVATMVMLALSGVSTYTNSAFSNVVIFEASLLIGAGVLLFALAGRAVGWLRLRPVVYIGTISYSMYLIHMCVLEMPVLKTLPTPLLPVVALAVTVIYAALTWTFVESRLLGRHRRTLGEARGTQPEGGTSWRG